MKKITLFLLAFVFLFSLSINSQTVGQEYLVNPGVNSATGADSATPDTGVDGSGSMPANLGGWTGGAGGAYAPNNEINGDCHSEDRMFKFYKVSGANGNYVYQDVEDLPTGNFNWSFYTRWGAVVDYDAGDAEKPTFTILTDDDADGTWEVVETIITTQPTAANTWVEQTGAFENDTPRDVRIRFHKNGGLNTAPSNLNQTMFIDDVSLKYDSEITYDIDDTTLADLTIDGAIIPGFLPSKNTYDISLAQGTTVVPTIAATANNPNATAVITAATSIPGTTTILVTAEDGTTTNTVSVNFFEGSAQTQLLNNGDFEQGAAGYWMSGISPESQAPIVTDVNGNKHYSNDVTNADMSWMVNTSQFVELVQGETYTLIFEAWSNVNRSIVAGLGLSGDPWTTISETLNINPTKKTFSFTFEAITFGDPQARVLFDIGADIGYVNIDNVILVQGCGAFPPVTSDIYKYTPINTAVQIELSAEDNCAENLSYTLTSTPNQGEITLNENIVTYTPATDFLGEDQFSYTANDGEFDSNESTVFVGMVEIPDITFSIDTNEIAEHQAATITATLSAPGPYDVEFDISSFSGTATEDDYVIASSYANGVRYIKFEAYYSSDSGQVNLNQIKALLSDGTNVACGKSGYANSYEWGGWDGNGSNVTNCNGGGRWSSNRNDPGPSETEPHYIVVDLEEIYDLDSIEIDLGNWNMSFSVLVSNDDQNWTNIGTYTNYSLDQVVFMDPAASGGFTIPSGETSVEIYVQGIEDNSTEGTESLTFEIPTVENANLLNPQEFTIDILDVVSSFTLIEDMFEGFSNAEFAWGDYDLDGDMDVAIMGDQGNGVETLLYRNDLVDGKHVFVDSQQNFEALGYGALKWVDIDKDGLLDLFVSGIGPSGVNSILYINTTNTSSEDFSPSSIYEFPDLFQSDIDFGDLDNDGDVDYAFNGTNISGQQVSFYGFQNASGEFNIVESNFGTFEEGAIKIFDVNSDGDNDVISSSQAAMNTYFNNNSAAIYPSHNFEELDYFIGSGSNTLNYLTIGDNGSPSTTSNINTSFPSFVNGDFSIADYNNDGVEDIFITGSNVAAENPGANEVSSILFQGNASTYEASTEFDFQGFTNSSVEWIDYDNDGDLDLFLSGFAPGLGQKTYLYEYEITNKKNTPPAKVTALLYEDLGNGYIDLSWEAPVDDFSAIMGYNLRLGTTAGGDELSYLLSNQLTGELMVNQIPSILKNSFSIQLDPGTYYWSVQAVDKGFKGGAFSNEQSFTLTYDWKVLNQGGVIDNSIQAVSNPILEFMDLDNDGDYDLIYGQSGSQMQIYSYQDNLLSVNQSYSINSSFQDMEIGDLNLDGSFDIVGKLNTSQNIVYLSGTEGSGIPFNLNTFSTNNLYDRKQRLADLNNDGNLDITNFGMDNQNEFLANFKLYSSYYDSESNSFITSDLSSNFSNINQMFSPSFDIGDFDNDNDLDVVLSGDLIFGENITKIFKNITEAGSQEIIFEEYTEADLPGVKDGSTDFIDFDSDGDLDLLISGFDNLGNKIFSMFENIEGGAWPEIETNLPEMTNTELDFGDFNADGLSDLLISGTNENDKNVTKLMEYVDGVGFVESDYDLSEFANAKFAFGDLDGDTDLDFVITGQSSTNENESLVRVYMNYRSESYDVINSGAKYSKSSGVVFNEAPSQPTISEITVLGENSDGKAIVNISWTRSTDDNTPQNSISYALKVGTSTEIEDIISSGALPSGYRKISGNGNAEFNTSWNIALDPGKYYVSVQSIDASFVGSEFSSESIFILNVDNSILSTNDNTNYFVGIYPNPSSSLIRLSVKDSLDIKELKIYDLLGKSFSFDTDYNTYIDVNNLSDGIYILELSFTNGNTITKKIIKN